MQTLAAMLQGGKQVIRMLISVLNLKKEKTSKI
jgi:hypothetical protein